MPHAAQSTTEFISCGAAVLATSVLADSAVEHYRGAFHNPAMAAPIAASVLSIGVNGAQITGRRGSPLIHTAAIVTGGVGLCFHVFNILAHPGRFRLINLFYAAPVGAPAALSLAGLLGRSAQGHVSGRTTGAIVVGGLLGTVGEVGLLHFRGAYHNPAMWLPVTLPPLAAFSLVVDVLTGAASRRSTILLTATALLGLAGAVFHAYGISRNMGGWRNWRQTLLAGPPVPAPPAFTGLAIAGLGALRRMRRHG